MNFGVPNRLLLLIVHLQAFKSLVVNANLVYIETMRPCNLKLEVPCCPIADHVHNSLINPSDPAFIS